MTPKQKAQDLLEKFGLDYAKKDCLTCVNEILSILETIHKPEYVTFYSPKQSLDGYETIKYWKAVKLQIRKI